MSIKVLGVFKLNSKITVEQDIEMAFWMTQEAINNKIGINLGGNIFSGWLSKNNFDRDEMPYEITDDPLDVNVDLLFVGDGKRLIISDQVVNTGESLLSRMNRVQNFLEKLLQHPLAEKVILDINIEDDEFETLECKVQNFSDTMIDLYKKEENWTSDIRLVITK